MPFRFSLIAFTVLLAAPAALAQPDLTISATAEDASGEAGDRVTIDYTATLTGAEEIEDVPVGFYFSTDQTLSSDDAFSEREEVDTESDESESDNEQIDIPASLADGDYFILVVIDDLDRVAESDETNNTAAIPFTVGSGGTGGGGGANLAVTSLSASPSSGPAGTEVEVEYQIDNAGSESTGGSQVAFYLSTDDALSTNDTFLTREDVDGVDANDSTDGDAEFTVPSSIAAGDYFLIAVADDRNAVTETDESDNARAVPFTVTGDGGGTGGGNADLVVSTASVTPTSAAAGAEIEVAYTLANNGTAEAGETQVGVYLSTDRSLSSGDLLVARLDGDGVDAGESEDSDEDVTVPNGASPGDYFLLFVADDRNTVSESRESNNTTAIAFTVTGSGGGTGGDGQADLRVSDASAEPTAAAPGTNVETVFSLENTGTSQAGASTVALYLSTDNSLSSSDTRLGSTSVDEVDANGDGDGEIDFTVPDDVLTGDYFLLFVADDGNDVSETRESNNVRAIPFAVFAGAAGEDTPTAGVRFESVAPNPVGPSARVAFVVDVSGLVRLSVVDALGREVAVLAEGERTPGAHEATWDTGALASGIYILRLSAGTSAATQVVTVAR